MMPETDKVKARGKTTAVPEDLIALQHHKAEIKINRCKRTWLHADCWEAWQRSRRAKAENVNSTIGLRRSTESKSDIEANFSDNFGKN
jgi:hypothetical protein